MAYEIRTDEALGEGLRRSAQEQLEGAVDALERKIEEQPGKAIHDARKRLKKTRALIRLARPVLGRKVARRENAALRSAAATLSAARDADVMVQTVEALGDRYSGRLPAAAFEAVRAAVAGDGGGGGGGAAPDVGEALAGIRGVLERIEDWPLADAATQDVLAGASVAYAAGRAQMPGPDDRPSAEELHEWRKRVKDLWYHGLLLQNAWPAVLSVQAEEAHVLSEVLGDDHDLSVLRDRLTSATIDDPAADVDGVVALIDHRREELQAEALDRGRRIYAEGPKAQARRLQAYVDAWQEPQAAGT
jgi:CHAD domain-containing protein